MDYQKELLSQYALHSAYIDTTDEEKLVWFRRYVVTLYAPLLAHFKKDAAIADLGCNKGYLLKVLHEQGFSHLVGVDLSVGDLGKAQIIVPQALLIQDDIFNFLETNKNSFDCIILKALIEHIKKDRVLELLQKINESLKPGGMVLIDVQNSAWLCGMHDRYVDFTHEIGFTKESLHQVMELIFQEVVVLPRQTPLWKMGLKGKISHLIARAAFNWLLHWAEPEAPSVKERILLGCGKKRC